MVLDCALVEEQCFHTRQQRRQDFERRPGALLAPCPPLHSQRRGERSHLLRLEVSGIGPRVIDELLDAANQVRALIAGERIDLVRGRLEHLVELGHRVFDGCSEPRVSLLSCARYQGVQPDSQKLESQIPATVRLNLIEAAGSALVAAAHHVVIGAHEANVQSTRVIRLAEASACRLDPRIVDLPVPARCCKAELEE